MTQEYVQMLRDAIRLGQWMLTGFIPRADQHAHYREIMQQMGDALDAPIPAATLRPMSEAPRDGKPFLIYSKWGDPDPRIAYCYSRDVPRYRVSNDTQRYSLEELCKDFKGWHPLPEVQL
jgi:hypothetical protein